VKEDIFIHEFDQCQMTRNQKHGRGSRPWSISLQYVSHARLLWCIHMLKLGLDSGYGLVKAMYSSIILAAMACIENMFPSRAESCEWFCI
jgi:hypothetical protein